MKKLFLSVITLVILGTISVDAQKFGFCELDPIVQIMPEYNKAQAILEGEILDVQNQTEEMQVEFNNKYKAYNDNIALAKGTTGKWGPAIIQVKEQELQQLQQRMQSFQQTSQQALQQRQMQLLKPISDKVDSVINVIMDEKGLSFVFKDLTSVQVNKKKCMDISPFIKEKLGLQ
ncbi:MAG: OmpH family outer membrane protein [Bacteroidota bacterium]|nr:OmpH family outer membrane protein [Bacteroidota bacterium]